MTVSREDWARVEELLPKARELPAAERAAFLEQHCRDAPGLRAEMESMLAWDDPADPFLDAPVRLSGGGPEPETLPEGTRLGAWTLGAPIGRGGMGEVFAAERADGQFEMQAAVKILKRGLDTDALLRRFHRERNILARLSHPNIARLLDAGATADGRPYFVMERVEGRPITEWCEARALPLPDTLLLMGSVCDAVAAAHRSRIVHRDLKPSNVLVNVAGEVKLLDFGIAKLLTEDDTSHTQTALEGRLLTPAYAAPEQILGKAVGTSADVYALGVMLFQLLTGELPHRREGVPLAVLAADLARETTSRPSAALRKAAPRRARDLAGDLDLIVLKALHADPERRYASALELGDDLRNFLERRPIAARPDTAGYLAVRFVQRHPVPVAAGAITALAVLVGLGVTLWQAQLARTEARRAQAVSNFVTQDLLAAVDPDTATAANITLKDMLAIAGNRIDERFADDPDAAARLHFALAKSYSRLGLQAERREQDEQALRLYDVANADPRLILAARFDLGAALKRLGQTRESARLQQAVLEERTRLFGPDDPDTLYSRLEVAYLSGRDGATQGLAAMRAVTEAIRRALPPQNDQRRLAEMSLGETLLAYGDYDEAESSLRQLLKSIEDHPAREQFLSVRPRFALFEVLLARGRYAEAAEILARLEEEVPRRAAAGTPQLADLDRYRVSLYLEQHRIVEAEAAARPIRERMGTARIAAQELTDRFMLAQLDSAAGRHEQAARAFGQLAKTASQLGSSQPVFAIAWADELREAGHYPQARAALGAAGPPGPELLPPSAIELRRIDALLRQVEGEPSQARAALAEVLAWFESHLGADHWRTRRAREELASAAKNSTPSSE